MLIEKLGSIFKMMVMYDYCEAPKLQVSTSVTVKNPIIHHSCDNKRYTSYEITLKSNDICFSLQSSTVRRRFSDFAVLRKLLHLQNPSVNPPPLPSKNLFRNRFSVEFIEQRGKELENFLQQLLDTPLYLSSSAFHLFLQSNLSMAEIETRVSGTRMLLSVPLEKEESQENHMLITNPRLSYRPTVDAQCQTYVHVEGESSNGSPSTISNSVSINDDVKTPSVPVLPCTIDRHVITERAQSYKWLGFGSKDISPCSSVGSTHSYP